MSMRADLRLLLCSSIIFSASVPTPSCKIFQGYDGGFMVNVLNISPLSAFDHEASHSTLVIQRIQ